MIELHEKTKISIDFQKKTAIERFNELESFINLKLSYLSDLLNKSENNSNKKQILIVYRSIQQLSKLLELISLNLEKQDNNIQKEKINHIFRIITRYIEKNIDLEMILKIYK